MVYTKNPDKFITKNYSEIMNLVRSCCSRNRVPSYTEDIFQETSCHIIKSNFLKKYDPAYGTKISSFLFCTINHIILNTLRRGCEKVSRNSTSTTDIIDGDLQTAVDTADFSDSFNVEYKNMAHRNSVSDQIDGLGFDLRCFDEFIERSRNNKRYFTHPYRDSTPETHGIRLSQIYKMLRDGYTNREIARHYDVSEMLISCIKQDISLALTRFGIRYQRYQSRKRKSV